MAYNDDTIEQLRFLAENWKRFSNWTRLQIFVTIWWFVKVRRPLRRLAKRLGLGADYGPALFWLFVIFLCGLAITGLARSMTGFRPHMALYFALMSAGMLIGLGLVQNGK